MDPCRSQAGQSPLRLLLFVSKERAQMVPMVEYVVRFEPNIDVSMTRLRGDPSSFRSFIMRTSISFVLLVSLLCAFGIAHAHKVNMFANVEGNRIVVEGYFADGKKAKGATIQVFAPDDTKLLQGKADEEGIFSFDVPQVTDLRISLYAGMGHRAEYTVPAAELQAPAGASGNSVTEDGAATPTSSPAAAVASVDPAEIRAIVQQAVGESLTPVMRSISELKEQKSFSDIVGGIGFIVGLLGIFFYLKARKERSSPVGAGPGTSG